MRLGRLRQSVAVGRAGALKVRWAARPMSLRVFFFFAQLMFWAALSWVCEGLVYLFPFFVKQLRRNRVRCLALAFLCGTGWGGDEFAVELIQGVDAQEQILEELVSIRQRRGRDAGLNGMLLSMVRA